MACASCAGIAVQPVPFADIFVLTPVQGFFASRIAAVHGVPVSEAQALDWVKDTIGLMGMAFIAQQVAIGAWKLVTAGAGAFFTIPLVYSLTYAIMATANRYYHARATGKDLTRSELKAAIRAAFRQARDQQP